MKSICTSRSLVSTTLALVSLAALAVGARAEAPEVIASCTKSVPKCLYKDYQKGKGRDLDEALKPPGDAGKAFFVTVETAANSKATCMVVAGRLTSCSRAREWQHPKKRLRLGRVFLRDMSLTVSGGITDESGDTTENEVPGDLENAKNTWSVEFGYRKKKPLRDIGEALGFSGFGDAAEEKEQAWRELLVDAISLDATVRRGKTITDDTAGGKFSVRNATTFGVSVSYSVSIEDLIAHAWDATSSFR